MGSHTCALLCWLVLYKVMCVSYIHIVTCHCNLFILIDIYNWLTGMYHTLTILPLGSFKFEAMKF